ncbi:MAG: hypothetical protein RLZZ142_944 [Verrucomicrobiota bacterium]|jgi:AraC-like DNA-binding protein/quercetin dioxygenase-like cupin family protein
MNRSGALVKRLGLPSAWQMQRMLSGREVGMGMVVYVAASQSLQASRISWHQHEHHEIVMLLSGSTGWEFEGGEVVHLKGNELVLVPPGLAHRGIQNVRKPSKVCVVAFRPERAPSGASPFADQDREWMGSRFHIAGPRKFPMEGELLRTAHGLHQMIHRCGQSGSEPQEGTETVLQKDEKILDVLPMRAAMEDGVALRLAIASVILAVARLESPRREAAVPGVLAAAMQFLETHYARPIQVDQVAAEIGCSRAQLYQEFQRRVGMGPNHWLQQLRLQKAEHWLRTTQRKLEDISEAVGFSSVAYFCTVFRKYSGMTPREWREQQRSEEGDEAPPAP